MRTTPVFGKKFHKSPKKKVVRPVRDEEEKELLSFLRAHEGGSFAQLRNHFDFPMQEKLASMSERLVIYFDRQTDLYKILN